MHQQSWGKPKMCSAGKPKRGVDKGKQHQNTSKTPVKQC